MPTFLPFRGLRYDPAAGDLSDLICPPYDVIDAEERERLLARHRYNAVRVEFPVLPGHENGGYAHAAAALRGWRTDGVMRLDESPSLYVYEARYRLGEGAERTQRGVFGRLRLEALGEGVRPHERTLAAPKEDRLRLLRATATDTSPIVLLADPGSGLADPLDEIARGDPATEAVDDAGVAHRLWILSDKDEATGAIAEAVGSAPLTIADGHHRYETALRYRDESSAATTTAAGRPADHVLALILDPRPGDGPTILPTHRLVLGDASLVRDVVRAVHGNFDVEHGPTEDVVAAFSSPFPMAPGRLGVVTPIAAAKLSVDAARVSPLFDGSTPAEVRALDVAVLDAVLRPFLTAHPDVRLAYTHDAREAAGAVESGQAIASFLLAPTPLESVIAVAAAGAVMPQKSTYFYPKAATGLVMYPLE